MLGLLMASWVLAQVILRLPWQIGPKSPVSTAQIVKVTLPGIIVIGSALRGLELAISGIAESDRPITDSTAFGGTSISLGLISLTASAIGFTLFARWWRLQTGVIASTQIHGNADPATSAVS